jgi:hypothetical protein
LQNFNVLVPEQFGFRKGWSTDNAAYKLTDSILKAWNKPNYVVCVFCNLAKAFDCVNHELLLQKLQFYGEREVILDWFNCYLLNGKQGGMDTLRTIYFAYFHSLVKYGTVFWYNSTNMKRVFLLQKRILRIMLGLGPRCSCKGMFKNLDILPVPCLYISSLIMLVVNNPHSFQTNATLHCINTRYKNQLHRPRVKFFLYTKTDYLFCYKPF